MSTVTQVPQEKSHKITLLVSKIKTKRIHYQRLSIPLQCSKKIQKILSITNHLESVTSKAAPLQLWRNATGGFAVRRAVAGITAYNIQVSPAWGSNGGAKMTYKGFTSIMTSGSLLPG